MAYIKEIRAGMSETLNLGNYESVRPNYELTLVLEEGDDPGECSKALYKEVRIGFLSNLIRELTDVPNRKETKAILEAAKEDLRLLLKECSNGEGKRPARVLRINR